MPHFALVLALAASLLVAAPVAAQVGYPVRWVPGFGELPEESCSRYEVDSFGAVAASTLSQEYLEIGTGDAAGFLYWQTTPRFVLTDVIRVEAQVEVQDGQAVLAVADGLVYLAVKLTPKFLVIGRSSFPIPGGDGVHRFTLEWDRMGSKARVTVQGLAFSSDVAPSLFLLDEAWEGIRWGNEANTTSRWMLLAHDSGSAPCGPRVAVEQQSWGTLKQAFGRD